jgi:hypothetical protein
MYANVARNGEKCIFRKLFQQCLTFSVLGCLQERGDQERPESHLEVDQDQGARSLQRRLQPSPQDRHLRLGLERKA